jgi:hypothetical protein
MCVCVCVYVCVCVCVCMCVCVCVYVCMFEHRHTQGKINHMPGKENTLLDAIKKTSQRMLYAIYVNKVKSPDSVLGIGNIDKKTMTCILSNSMT